MGKSLGFFFFCLLLCMILRHGFLFHSRFVFVWLNYLKPFPLFFFFFNLLRCVYFTGTSRYKNPRGWFSYKQPQFPYGSRGKEAEPGPAEPHVFPWLPPSQCQPAAQPLRQEDFWWLTLGCHHSQPSRSWPWLGKGSCSSGVLLCATWERSVCLGILIKV